MATELTKTQVDRLGDHRRYFEGFIELVNSPA